MKDQELPNWKMYGGVVFMGIFIYCGKDNDTEERYWAIRLPNYWKEQRFDNVKGAIGAVVMFHREQQIKGYPRSTLDARAEFIKKPPKEPPKPA